MPRLPDPNAAQRPTPRFGGAPPQVPVNDAQPQALSELGSSIAGFGEILARKQVEDDKYRVEDATTRLKQRMLELSKGDEGFIHTRSGDVDSKFHGEHMSRFDQARAEIENSLESDDQKAMFSRRANLARVGHNEELINHITREREAFKQQAYNAGIATEKDIAATDYDNENIVKSSIYRIEQLTKAEAERLGWDAKTAKMVTKEHVSNAHEAVIMRAIEDQNYEYAKTWYEKNQKSILGERQDDIEKVLRASGIKKQSQDAVDNYVGEGLTETQAKEKARKEIKDADLRDATIARINVRYAEAAQELDASQKAAGEKVYNIYAETWESTGSPEEAWDAIPETLLEKMDGKERIALFNKMKADSAGTAIKTDKATYYALRRAAADPAEFRQINLMQFADKLSNEDFQEFVRLQTDPQKFETARTKQSIMDHGAVSAGLDPKKAKETGDAGDAGDEVRAYYERVDQELLEWQKATGKEPTPVEVKEITDRLALQVLRERKTLFDWMNPEFLPNWMTDPNIPIWSTSEKAAAIVEIEGIPKTVIDELAQDLYESNKPVTEENIKKLYNDLVTR